MEIYVRALELQGKRKQRVRERSDVPDLPSFTLTLLDQCLSRTSRVHASVQAPASYSQLTWDRCGRSRRLPLFLFIILAVLEIAHDDHR